MAQCRAYMDRQGDHVSELALAWLIEDGELQAHIRRMHRLYDARREVLFSSLTKEIPELRYDPPSGGLAVWARVPHKVSANQWMDQAEKRGVLVQAASAFFMDRRNRPWLRLGFARHNPAELREAVRRLAQALPKG